MVLGFVFAKMATSTSAVQKLYDVCKVTFTAASTTPSVPGLQRVRNLLDSIKAADVGMEEDAVEQQERGFGYFGQNGRRGWHSSMVVRWAPPITYLHLYECEQFSMGIFCLPTSAVIPLHNHPGMTVLSKLLYGSMHVHAYDWVHPFETNIDADASESRLAKLVVDHVITAPCETAVLYPTSGGNIHAFTAVTPCAVLDVLAPPYSTATGRHCTYYRNFPSAGMPEGLQHDGDKNVDDPGYDYLEEFQPPDDFVVAEGHIQGTKVVP